MAETAIWKALSDEKRRMIIRLLLKRDFCVRALSRRLGISEAAVSQHMKVLKQAGLIDGVKRGYFVHYTVNRGLLKDLGAELIQLSEMQQETVCPKNCGNMPCHAGCGHGRHEGGCARRGRSADRESK
ncbi:MAG: metalloregulator ArsR/SmtB family transcription factor [Eubacterium sp.]|jgi:ArsR family transcriptional regulator|nr:metalloregulator ArsR/SmtB family transcription factor [Eubacterium sp.]MCI2198041.1 metalloregulator ArsR/SmtB family transcription factor [Eubacterium sp.]